jgi:cytochrome c oxidase assembly protein subunit 15
MHLPQTDRARSAANPWLHRFAVVTAAATLALIGIGGLVTSRGVGMAVYDWPTSYGYNMFALPIHLWKGGVFYEHTHRLWASFVGVLVVALARWLGGRRARLPLAIVGLTEVLGGIAIFSFWPDLKGTGHFLTGIGGVVLLASAVWVRNEPAQRPLPMLGWLLFALVQVQGLLGGLRVVLFKDEIGIFHASLAQLFFVLTCAVVLLTHRKWSEFVRRRAEQGEAARIGPAPGLISGLFVCATVLIFLQLILGAAMRHQHAGLAIPDFPLAYGKLWPAMDPDSVARYNAQRLEITSVNSITAFQIVLQMAHRMVAVLILGGVIGCAWTAVRQLSWRSALAKGSVFWLGLIAVQAGLGAATVLTNKAADVATAHVLAGALSLATGAMMCIVLFCNPGSERRASSLSRAEAASDGHSFAAETATAQ